MTWAMRRYRWLVWIGIYALIGLLTFPLEAPGATALQFQFVWFVVAGVAILGVFVLDYVPAATRWRERTLPVTLCILAAAGGLTATAGFNENNCAVTLASMAATTAALELRRWQAWMVILAAPWAWRPTRSSSATASHTFRRSCCTRSCQ